jgi:menin
MASSGALSSLFPLRTVNDVRKVFEVECQKDEPDLGFLSIVAGTVENTMTKACEVTMGPPARPCQGSDGGGTDVERVTNATLTIEPRVEWHVVDGLNKKFEAVIRGYCDVNLLAKARDVEADFYDVRKLIKHVADIIWNTLSKAQYKDRPHLQSIYSYLTGNKLDCFGVAFAVVAACQLLQVPGVHLALSEDHACKCFAKKFKTVIQTLSCGLEFCCFFRGRFWQGRYRNC